MEVYQSSKTAAEMEYALSAIPSIGANNHWFIGDQDTGVLAEGLTPYVGQTGNWWIGETDTGVYAGGVKVEGAAPGQIIKIAEVDELGRPTAWEPADLKLGWKLVGELILEEDVQQANVRLSEPVTGEIMVMMSIVASSAATTNGGVRMFFNGNHAIEMVEWDLGVYRGLNLDIFYTREYYENWLTPVVTNLRYGTNLAARRTWDAGSNVTISSVNVFASNTNALLGIGTTVKVYARG